ncbi:MAG: M1 family metallopeptidase [Polyangiaceae bacterium]|nr:M1 family metallopeptidase [Polyangiaceae bacterium]
MRAPRPLVSLLGLATVLAACVPPEPAAPIPPPYKPPLPPVQTQAPAPQVPVEPVPLGRLPTDVQPLRTALFLQIDPRAERISGTATIEVNLTRPRDVIWFHGKNIHSRGASVLVTGANIQATYHEVDPSGVAALRLDRPIGPGHAVLRVDYDAPFSTGSEGLYLVERGGQKYAFTQFEAVAARQAFPCFDEPAFKTPFDLTLFVPRDMEAIANTREVERTYVQNDLVRISYAPTQPLPSYLLAFAVGPLDIVNGSPIAANTVRKQPIPLRGVAVRGRGKELTYALAHTAEVVATLEAYTGIAYPFDKLDIIAVPDKRGAMENAGAITFAEQLLFIDETRAPLRQKRAFWSVMTHELAHQWFGNLVTMPWWDDTWLKEAFATWATGRVLTQLRPEDGVELSRTRSTFESMNADGLVSARQVRQEIRSSHDIQNAFDDITYRKGGGVIRMFEEWMGKDAFRTGVSSYLSAHAGSTATADDLFAALSVSAGRDVSSSFRSFINQPGVPLLDTELICSPQGNYLTVKQSRHLPVGSAGDSNKTWQIPVCAKFPNGKNVEQVCSLFTGSAASIPLPAAKCPAWVMPNAGASGYYLSSMPLADLKKLTGAALKELSPSERFAVAHNLKMAFQRGTPVADLLPLLNSLAGQPDPPIVAAVMEPYRVAKSWFSTKADREAIESEARRVFGPVWKNLGWEPKKGASENDDRRALRAELLQFMVVTANDTTVKKEAAARGRAHVGYGTDGAFHPEAVDADLATPCLIAAALDGDTAFYEHLVRTLTKTRDDVVKSRIVTALASFQDPAIAARALAFSLDPQMPSTDLTTIVDIQLGSPITRARAFGWFQDNLTNLANRRTPSRRGTLPLLARDLCERPYALALSSLFADRIDGYEGGPRNLNAALESIHLCSARRAVQEASFRKAFKMPDPPAKSASWDPADSSGSPSLSQGSKSTRLSSAAQDNGVIDPWQKKGAKTSATPSPTPKSSPPSSNKSDVADPWAKSKKPAKPSTPSPSTGSGSAGKTPPNGVIDPWVKPKQ